jgi:hypothetical protein
MCNKGTQRQRVLLEKTSFLIWELPFSKEVWRRDDFFGKNTVAIDARFS